MPAGYCVFATSIGRCAIGWSERGIAGVVLPRAREDETRAALAARIPDAIEAAPPEHVRSSIDAIVGLLSGERPDLSLVPIDLNGVPPFHRRVYEVTRAIAPGTTVSYGDVARRLGAPGSARAVGQALSRNPFAIVVPCHRVMAAGGRIGGFSASGGIATKFHLLALEAAGLRTEATRLADGATPSFDPAAAIAHLQAADHRLGQLIAEVGPFRMRLTTTSSLFAALAQAIVSQQLNGRAAGAIFARVRALFRDAATGPTPTQILRASDEKLRGAGLSRGKLASLRDLAQKTLDRTLPSFDELSGMEDDAIVDRLTQVRGVGRWTVEMVLMFRLGRTDVLPLDDYGIRKGFSLTFGTKVLPSRQELERHGARWRPYRTVASWYLWRALEKDAASRLGAGT